MRTLLAFLLAATALFAQSTPVVDEPILAGVLDSSAASQFLLPFRGFSATQLAFSPVPHPALRAGATTLYAPDPLLCAADYASAEVDQLVIALPQGGLVLLDASSSLALHVLAVPAGTWSLAAGICIDRRNGQVVLLDAAQPRFMRIDLADLRAGIAQFRSTPLPPAWSAVRGIAFDVARDRIVGLDPATGDLLQHSAAAPATNAGTLRPLPALRAFCFAPPPSLSQPGVDLDLFVTSGDQRMLTDQWTWNATGTDDETATLEATVSTNLWTPPSPDPSGITYDALNDRFLISDSEVDEMTIYAGANVYETSRTGTLARVTTTVGYTNEPTGLTLDSATRTFYFSDDDHDRIWVVAAGPDGLVNTADDSRRSFSVGNFCADAESLAFDNTTGTLWIAGGIAHLVHRLRPGPNGIFDGIAPNGDDVLASFDIAPYGVTDPSGVAVRSGDGGIHVLGIPKTRLLHLNKVGQLVRVINLPSTSMVRPQGIVFAPSTVSTGDSLFLVDRGQDNDFDPLENDGKLREYGMPAPALINMQPVVNAGPDVTILTTASAHLAGIAEDDGLPGGPLAIQWTKLSGPGTASFTAPTEAATDVSFSAAGSYTLELSAFDGELTSTDTVVVTVNAPPPGVILERTVAHSWDDAEEQPTTVVRAGTDLEMVVDGSINQVVGIRFLNLAIPPGSTVASAYVQFTTDAATSIATDLTIAGQASDNAATFQTTAFSISTRPRTTATVAWTPLPWTLVGEAGLDQRTPELAAVVQQVVSRPGWVSGNAIVFVITGTGCRNASSFDRSPALAPKLVVRYLSPVVNEPPVVDAGPDVTTLLTSAAHLAGSVTDDGLPGPLAIQWSLLSGPGTASFTTPDQAVTDVTFSLAGSYTCQLSAFDGEHTRTDTCVVTVQQPNQPPVVDAGPDVTTLLTSAAHLAGSVTDDGQLVPLTIQWSKLSGPGTASFTAPNQAVTDVAFSLAGSYTCQLSAFDGEHTRTDTCVVTVQQPNLPPVVDAGPDVTVTSPSAAHLVGTVTDDGQLAPLTIQWSKLSGPGTASFTTPNQAVTDVAFSLAGSYTCQLSAYDGQSTVTDTVEVTVQPPPPVTLNIAIANKNDDAEQRGAAMDRTSNSLEMVMDGAVNQLVGLRFTGVAIPRGAIVTSANLQFTNKTNNSSATQLVVAGAATDDAAGFSNSSNNISNRPRTTAMVAWAPAAWTTVNQAGPNQRTPDLASVVQEIVNRPGWISGNAMVFIISGTTGTRSAHSRDSIAANAPKLVVTYHL